MWWQVIPSAIMVGGCVGLIPTFQPMLQFISTGKPTIRTLVEGNIIEVPCRTAWRRDVSLVGNEYESRGFDYLPDD